jgi:hypothetical protein
MGYYTTYNLRFDCSQKEQEINNEISKIMGANVSEECLPGRVGNMKWYNHAEDMKKVSALFPDVLFTLEGEGEDAGDLWKEYFLNGKSHRVNVEITYAPFDESKLK